MDITKLIDKARTETIEGVFGEAFRKAALAEYDLTRIPGIEKIREKALAELNGQPPLEEGMPPVAGLKQMLAVLEAQLEDHSKKPGDLSYVPHADLRQEKKKLEANIRKHEEFVLQCDEEITNIRKGAQTSMQVAANLLDRIKFVEGYAFDLATLPTARPEEAVQPLEKIHDPKTADQPLKPAEAAKLEGAVTPAADTPAA